MVITFTKCSSTRFGVCLSAYYSETAECVYNTFLQENIEDTFVTLEPLYIDLLAYQARV